MSATKSILVDECFKSLVQTTEYRAISVVAGRQIIEKALEYQPDLIVLNADQPDGFELCQQLKHDSRLKPIPIILLGKETPLTNAILAYKVGADHFLINPDNNPSALTNLIEDIFSRQLI